MTLIASILVQHDDGERDVAAIASACRVSPGYVYGVLREHRPDRERKPRARTGKKREKVLRLIARGKSAGEIARQVECSRAYVHRLIGEIPPPPY